MKWNVVIPCYQYGHYLTQAVESVLANNTEKIITIVNDCSPDDTDEIAQRLRRQHDCIRYIKNDENLSLSKSRNKAIQATESDFILCLDADDWISDNYLTESEKVLAEKDVAVSDLIIVDESVPGEICFTQRAIGGNPILSAPESVCLGRLRNGIGEQPRGRLNTDTEVKNRYQCVHAASPFRRSCWSEVGGYDESEVMKLGWEDYEFYIRLCKLGKTFGKVHGRHLFHRIHRKHKMHYSADKLGITYREFHDKWQDKIWEYLYKKHPDVWPDRKRLLL